MLSNGGKISEIYPAVFCWHDGEKLNGVIAVHVDDFFWSGSPTFEKTVITKFVNFMYLGLEMQQHSGYICLDQSEYIKNLDLIQLDPKRQKETDESLTDVEKDKLRSKIGQLL